MALTYQMLQCDQDPKGYFQIQPPHYIELPTDCDWLIVEWVDATQASVR